jgi:hypothetical protein
MASVRTRFGWRFRHIRQADIEHSPSAVFDARRIVLMLLELRRL